MILHAKKQHSVVCPFRRIGFIVPLCRTRKRLANSDYPTIIRVERQVKPNPSRSWMNSFDEIFFNDTKNSRPLRRNQTLMQVVVRQIPSIRIYNCLRLVFRFTLKTDFLSETHTLQKTRNKNCLWYFSVCFITTAP